MDAVIGVGWGRLATFAYIYPVCKRPQYRQSRMAFACSRKSVRTVRFNILSKEN